MQKDTVRTLGQAVPVELIRIGEQIGVLLF